MVDVFWRVTRIQEQETRDKKMEHKKEIMALVLSFCCEDLGLGNRL